MSAAPETSIGPVPKLPILFRFDGACYQAANSVRVGQTQGRSRQNRPNLFRAV
jgi:hypothetical protein